MTSAIWRRRSGGIELQLRSLCTFALGALLLLACSLAAAQSAPKPPAKAAPKPTQPAAKPSLPTTKPTQAAPKPAQSGQKPAMNPTPKPTPKPVPAQPKPQVAQPAKTGVPATPTGEDPIRGEEYLFKMAAALIKPGTTLGLIRSEGTLAQFNSSLAGGSYAVDFTAELAFPDRMRMTSEVMGRLVSVELSDSIARSVVGGMSQAVPSAELLAELARHYLNLARMCKQLKAVYLGSPLVDKVRLLHLRVQVPTHRHGPVELFLDPKTFLPKLLRFSAVDPFTQRVEPTEERLSNWQVVAGVRMAYQREVFYNGKLVTEEQLTRHTSIR